MNNENENNNGGYVDVALDDMGFHSWLGLLFIAFKLAGIINWDWIQVLSPFWITYGFLIIFSAMNIVIDIIFDESGDE